ncbi:caspase recruitment domain-containing protein 19 isoform X5 [Tursiops truncatus]|uniref:caspase recruitment domain-containing protein 19 isoform X5 n=1 Tax=Tursiops truncatus TaxID=9739 RepID=UPI003CCF1350
MVAHRVRVSRCHTGGRSSRRRVTLPVTKCPVDETTVGRLAARGRVLGGRGHSGSRRVLGGGGHGQALESSVGQGHVMPWRLLSVGGPTLEGSGRRGQLCLPPSPGSTRKQDKLPQTYCDRLVQDMPFLTGLGRLSEQQVDRIILQLNRYYPQILSNKDAEKVPRNLRLLSHPFPLWAGRSGGQDSLEFRNPKVSLRVRLCDLLGHLQRSGERDCQEFYRALYIHAQPLHSCLPSRHALRKTRGLPDLSRPGRRAGTPRLLLPPRPQGAARGQACPGLLPCHRRQARQPLPAGLPHR